ncbi:MAG: ComEC/Rec2 family competence protein [Candidatus Peribacteraceae bacterium]|nr:ComEC/Rec2 family competence protein [Candidatus Peribacteraceae bacterium]
MRPSHISYAFLGSFLTAVFALRWWQASTYPWQFFLVLGLFGILGILAARRRHALILLAMVFGTSAALWTVSRTTHIPSPETIDTYVSADEIAIKGVIADDPDRRALKTNYIVEAELLKNGTQTIPVHGRVLMTVRIGNPLLDYGDVIVAQGVLEQPENTDDFRYDRYLSLKSVYSLINDPMIERTGENRGNFILRAIYRFKRSLENRITLLLPEPHASLLAGLLLGSRGSMPDDLTQDFKNTGLTHIVAISGFNITLLITVMGTLLFWLPLKWRFWPSVILIAGFTLLTGASASAVRAAMMGILGLLALQLNRMQTTRLTVLWSAFFMLAWNPKQLWYDAGFQLSFLALIGVLEISPLLKPYLRRVPEFLGIQESFCLTLSAQMIASPWILFLFGQFSVIAPVSNLLAPPAVPYAMLLGTLSLLLGWIWMPLGKIMAAIAWLPLQWITSVAHLLSSLPYASLDLPGLSTFWIVLYYGCMTLWVTTHTGESSSSPSIPAAPSFRPAAAAGR